MNSTPFVLMSSCLCSSIFQIQNGLLHSPDFGPYIFPVDATSIFGCSAAVVSVPPANARSGLLAWAALGHETAGHDILHADTGLSQEISKAVQIELENQGLRDGLPEYWSSRIDETASDVCGILNMGPAAGKL